MHTKISPTLVEYTKGLQSFAVPEKLSVSEAASLFEVWTKGTAMHDGKITLFIWTVEALTD